MANASTQFGGFLTNVGIAQQANTSALGIPWNITHMLIGDAGGEPSVTPDPTPNPAQTALVRQVHRAQLNALYQSPTDPAVLIAELVLPPETGGWWIRELALEDANGNFIAVAKPPPSYKPLLAQGSGRTQTIRMHVLFGNTANVSLKIDPSIVLATRDYVDTAILSAVNKQDFKYSVQAATAAAVLLSGLLTVDGVVLPAGARVLVKDQAQAKDNGIYVVSAGAWARSADADASAEVTPGLFVHVEQGTVNGDSVWQLVTDAPITLGTTALAFEMVAGRTGVTAGNYTKVTVDKYGRVVGGTNPTTLAGMGIGDAYTKAEVDAIFAQASALVQALAENGPVVGSTRNGKMQVSAASATANYTADEVVVKSGLGGLAYVIPNFNKTIDLAIIGEGGMDTGVAPSNGWVALYAIYNQTSGESSILAVNSPNALMPEIYGGANMPAGYTASALLTVVPTNASRQLKVCAVQDRKVLIQLATVYSGNASVSNNPISIAGIVPANAIEITAGEMTLANTAQSAMSLSVFSDASHVGQQNVTRLIQAGGADTFNYAAVPIITPQEIMFTSQSSAGTPTYSLYISGYKL